MASGFKLAEATTLSWKVNGRSRRCRTGSPVSVAIGPARRQEKTAAEDDVEEHGRHVCSRCAGSAQKSFLGVATRSFD